MNNFSKLGFILATLGSSIGLGHIWRFPYMIGENGGGAFVLLFLVMSLVIGVAMLIGEMLIGNKTGKNPIDAFKTLDPSPNKRWKYAGLTLIGGPIILTFYCVVLGWMLHYLFVVNFDLPNSANEADMIFSALIGNNLKAQILGFSVMLGLSALIVSFGIKEGIEKLNIVLMPLLFVIFIGLLIYASFQPSFIEAVKFLFDFRYEDLNFNIFISSLAQMCFSLSLGVGIIITYSARAESSQNLAQSAMLVMISGIVISLIAGLVIFTFVYQYGVEATQGVGLVFKSLPIVFGQMGFVGVIISVLFFIGLIFAGITSTISLLEPSVMLLTQKYNQSRIKATWLVTLLIYIAGLVIILSLYEDYKNALSMLGKSLFDLVDFLSTAIIMPFGALLGVIFVGWILKKDKVQTMTQNFLSKRLFNVWFFIIRYVAPLVVIVAWIGVILEQ